MKRLFALAGLLASVACMFFFARSIEMHWNAISASSWGSAVWTNMGLAMVIYVGTYAVVAYAWNCSLRALGNPLPYWIALDILAVSQFAKYLPGNVGHHVGRVVLGKRAGLPTDVILGSMFLDTVLVLAAGGLWSLWVVQLLIRVIHEHGGTSPHLAWAAVIGALALAILVTLLLVVPQTMSRQLKHLSQLIQMENGLLLVRALCAHTGSFLLGGTALYLLCKAFDPAPIAASWITVTGVFAASWLLGFLIPGAPAGLGVREVALLLGLGPLFGAEVAAAAAASLRVVTTAGDGLVFILALSVRGKRSLQA